MSENPHKPEQNEQTHNAVSAKQFIELRQQKRFMGLLGIARKGGFITSGTNLVVDAIRSGSKKSCPQVVFLASDASENTKKRVTNCCTYYQIPFHHTNVLSADMGAAIGKSGAISAVGITDRGLAAALTNLFGKEA